MIRLCYFALCLCFACSFSQVDLSSKTCKCIDGFVCVADRCIQREADAGADVLPDAGLADALVDASPDQEIDDAAADGEVDGMDADLPSLCQGSTVICNDFEGTQTWSSEISSATILEHTTLQSVSGVSSLLAQSQAVGGYGGITRPIVPAIDDGSFYVRFQLRPVEANALVTVLRVGDPNAPFSGVAAVLDYNKMTLYNSITEAVVTVPESVNLNAWNCVRMFVDVDGSSGLARLSLNDSEWVDLINVNTLPVSGAYSFLIAGLPFVPPDEGPVTLFIDDIVVSRDVLSCDL